MRTMLKVHLPVERGNEVVKNGKLAEVVKRTMETWKPEAAYFFPDNGKRSFFMIFDLKDPSQIPAVAEPFFQELNAEFELIPVMNADDLMKGLAQISK